MSENLSGMLHQLVREHGPSEAIVDGQVRLSYAQFLDAAAVVAARLRDRGVQPGDRIAIVLPNCWQYAVSYFGIQLVGAIAVLVNVRLTTSEIDHILLDCGATIVVTDDALSDRVSPESGVVVIPADELTAAGPGAESLTQLPGFARRTEETAHLLYTSGTTGKPKGAMQTHANLLFNARTVRARLGAAPGSRTLIAAPMFHATGTVSQFIGFLSGGGCCVFTPAFRVETSLKLIVDERITFMAGVAAMLRLILLRADADRADLSALRLFVMGGSAVPQTFPAEVLTRLPGLVLGNVWGMTEGTSIVTYVDGQEYLDHSWSVGKAVEGTDLAVSVNGGEPQIQADLVGELCVRGPLVTTGYWANPTATASTFVDGWLHTGDVGSIDSDGYVRVLDRLKDMIIRGGENIYCLEVENALAAHPDVTDVAVVGVPDPVFDERVRAVIVAGAGAVPTPDELNRFARTQLADYKIPVEYLFLDELPRNASGKVVKRELVDIPLPETSDVPS